MKRQLKKRILGKWQLAALSDIALKKVCCHLRIVDKVHGTAKKWDRKYLRSLKRAIDAHNHGIAKNSPIDPKFVVMLGPCGYYLDERSKYKVYQLEEETVKLTDALTLFDCI